MITRLLDIDPETGAKEMFHYDEDTKKFYIETIVDIEPVLEFAHEQRKEQSNRWNDFACVASVPLGVFFEMKKKLGPVRDNQTAWLKWLSRSDQAPFRTKTGRLA